MCFKVEQIKRSKKLNVPLGVNENGEQDFLDFNKVANILVFGKTGSGKSTFLHKIIKHLKENYSKKEISLYLIDLKQTEFLNYKENVFFDLEKTKTYFTELVNKINTKCEKKEILTIIIVDECCDLLCDKEAFYLLKTIAKNGIKINAHLILSTQMISEKVLEPSLKENFNTRICFSVANKKDSFLTIGKAGAEKLKTGEFLFKSEILSNVKKLKV